MQGGRTPVFGGEWGELVERGYVYIPPAPKQVLPRAQSHCLAKRTVPLLIASDRLPLSSALPSSTSSISKNALRHDPPPLNPYSPHSGPLPWVTLLRVQPTHCPSTRTTRTLSLQLDHTPSLEVDTSRSTDPPSW